MQADPSKADVEKFEAERKTQNQRQKELDAPKMKELRKASLDFFDQWRTGVIERVGEVVNSKETAHSQMRRASTTEDATHAPPDRKLELEDKEPTSASSTLVALYPPVSTSLLSLEKKKRILVLHSVLLLLLSLEHYVSHSRVLLLYLTSSLHLHLDVLTSDEEKVAKGLLEAAKQMSGDQEAQKKAEENKSSRKWKVGIASVAGAAVIGLTGGLAAPMVAAGVGSVMGGLGLGATAAAGYLGSVAGSTLIVGGLFGAYGGKMTGQMMDNYAKEVDDFAFLPVHGSKKEQEKEEAAEKAAAKKALHQEDSLDSSAKTKDSSKSKAEEALAENTSATQDIPKEQNESDESAVENPAGRRLRVAIGVTGWLTEEESVIAPWRVFGTGSESFALRWELEALMNLGNSMHAMVSSAAWGYAKSEIIQRTIFAELAGALWPIALLKVSRVVDNPFSIARSRADKAGAVLADALINKAQGERPVTLVGYSLGARVIYSCLLSLAQRKAFGLVESVVLIGAPTPSTTSDWRTMRSVVASRLVNVYSANDYVLGFLYRTSSIQYGVAGLQKIEGLPGVENVDVSSTVSGHLRYRYLVGSILAQIGFEDVDMEAVAKEEEALKKMDEEEERKTYVEQARKEGKRVLDDGKTKVHISSKDGKAKEAAPTSTEDKEGAEAEAEQMERDVKEKTERSMGLLRRAREKLPAMPALPHSPKMPNIPNMPHRGKSRVEAEQGKTGETKLVDDSA